MSRVVSVTSETFRKEVLESPIPVVLDLWAPWCGPCRMVGPVLEQLAERYAGRVKVVKVNVDEEPELSAAFKVRSIPMIVAMRDAEVVDGQIGFSGRLALAKMFDGLLKSGDRAASA